MAYTLVLRIDRSIIRRHDIADSHVVVARSPANAAPTAEWIVTRPEPLITVRWEETYGVYAAEPANGAGSSIADLTHPVEPRMIYPFHGRFGIPIAADHIPTNHYDVRNDTPEPRTFGLLQSLSLNGTSSLRRVNAAVVLPGGTADFAAANKLYLALRPIEAAHELDVGFEAMMLDPGRPVMEFSYDDESASFVYSSEDTSCR